MVKQALVDRVLHEVASIEVEDWNVIAVEREPALVARGINVALLIPELCAGGEESRARLARG